MSGSSNRDQAPHGRLMRLPYGPENLQFGELHLPGSKGPYPIVILIHGGFWRAPYAYTLMTGLAKDLTRRGIAAWNIEYRRIGDRGGGWPATFLDVARAADYLRTLVPAYALDLRRLVTMGHSAGGHLALWLAARPRITKSSILASAGTPGSATGSSDPPLAIKGVISLAGVADLEMGWRMNLGHAAVAQLLGGSPTSVPERYAAASPASMLPLGVPQILIHGTEDDSVPFEVSQAYTAAAQAAGDRVKLVKLQGAEHFVLIDARSAAWATTVEALRELLNLN